MNAGDVRRFFFIFIEVSWSGYSKLIVFVRRCDNASCHNNIN